MGTASFVDRTSAPRAECRVIDCGDLPVDVYVWRFTGTSGVDELQLTATPTRYDTFAAQLGWLEKAYRLALDAMDIDDASSVMRRFFVSDLVNQATTLSTKPFANPRNEANPCAVSWVGQPPVGSAKVTLWAYHVVDPAGLEKTQRGTTCIIKRGDIAHHWSTNLMHQGNTSLEQSDGLLRAYIGQLDADGMTLADHVLRTWLFVRDIDANYAGLVQARRELFARHGLTAETHYIASSGIGGCGCDANATVLMDAYAAQGISSGQIEFIKAADHLSPTHIYGVTFERATSVAYRDRKHVLISGTASIDHEGNIVHPGDVLKQFDRTMENIDALLGEAGTAAADMGTWIVYLRDTSDAPVISCAMRERLGDVPMVMVHAPVCRPGWLIEIEGLATTHHTNANLPAF